MDLSDSEFHYPNRNPKISDIRPDSEPDIRNILNIQKKINLKYPNYPNIRKIIQMLSKKSENYLKYPKLSENLTEK